MLHVAAAILLAAVGAAVTHALGYGMPWPPLVAGIVFLAYFGVVVLIFDADWG